MSADPVLLPASNGCDDTAVVNAALATRRHVAGLPGQTYLISAPLDLRLPGTRLTMSGCTVRLLPGPGCNMLRNATSGRLADVEIVGGTWDRGANAGLNNDTHSLFLRRMDRLTVRDLRVTSTAGKYAVALGDVAQVRVHSLSFDTASDGVHITGPASMVDIRSISGRTGDDMVAFTARDWTTYDDVRGDIANVTVDGVYSDGSLAVLKAISGTGLELDGVTVRQYRVSGLTARNLFGTTTIRPIAIMDDTTGPTVADGILIDGVDVQCPPSWSLIWLRGVTSTDITIREVRLRAPMTAAQMILIDRPTPITRIASLTIDGVTLAPGAVTQAHVVGIYGLAHVGALRLSRVRIPAANAWTGLPVKIGSVTATVDSQVVDDVYTVTY